MHLALGVRCTDDTPVSRDFRSRDCTRRVGIGETTGYSHRDVRFVAGVANRSICKGVQWRAQLPFKLKLLKP